MTTITNITPLEELLGPKLLLPNGEEVSTQKTLANKKQIVLYFSAHWCPPCRGFTPKLAQAYEEYCTQEGEEKGLETQVVFVSRDQNVKEFLDYHQTEMTFPAIPFDNELSTKLAHKFGIDGIPSLVALNASDGSVIESKTDLRILIMKHGAAAFPLTPNRLLELEAEEQAKAKRALKGLIHLTVTASSDGSEPTSLSDILQKHEHVALLLGDGDASDPSYKAVEKIVQEVNNTAQQKQTNTDRKDLAVAYLGWSLYNEQSSHTELAKRFEYSMPDVLENARSVLTQILGEDHAKAPTLLLLRKGTGLCSMDGTCEEKNTPVIVATDPGLAMVNQTGATAFPWDKTAIAAFEEIKTKRLQTLRKKFKGLAFLSPDVLVGGTSTHDKLQQTIKEHSDDDQDNDLIVGLYFSAHWCGPCKMFTPKLVDRYEQVNEKTKKGTGKTKLEIIFASSDMDQASFDAYHQTMTTTSDKQFLALDFEKGHELKKDLSELLQVSGIPTLVLISPSDGTIVNTNGVELVLKEGANAFL